MRTAGLVFTTIFDARALRDYRRNFQRFGHLEQVDAFVIPDRKTPPTAFALSEEMRDGGLRTACPTLEAQEDFLKRIGMPPESIPFDSDNRRNVGYLMAFEKHPDFVISIDDDNYCAPDEDVFGQHAVVCCEAGPHRVASSGTGFFNICDLLEMERPAPAYPRGYPYYARHREAAPRYSEEVGAIDMNAGLWTVDPDVDAMTWLVAKPHVVSFKGESVVLAKDTWTPVNTQNTSLRLEVLPAYYYIRMGYPVSGLPIDRFGDIFSGYFAQACVKHLGGLVRVGTPVAEHRRNSHNYMKDAANELGGVTLLEDLLPWLVGARLSGSTFVEAYESLSYAIEDAVERFRGGIWTDSSRAYFHQVAYHMRAWLKAIRVIAGSPVPGCAPS
jgi:hypothetical protein